MMEFISNLAQDKGVAPTAICEEGHTEATANKPPKDSPMPPSDGVDKMYSQLAEIHALTAAQLAECARWHWSNLTSNMAHAGASWQGRLHNHQ
jgi:hypothetical protein